MASLRSWIAVSLYAGGYHSRLKNWMCRFNGVATKYLPRYLGWRRLFEREGDDITAQRCLLAALG